MTSRAGGRGWAIFAVCSLGFMISMFYRMSVTVIAVPLARDLGLSTSQLGTVSAMFFFAFSLSQVPLGPVLDRLGARWPMTILMLLGACGAVVFAFSESMAQAVIGRILLGLGMCSGLMGSFSLFAHWFPARRFGTMTGLFMGMGVLGNMLASTPLALLAQKVGWRESFLLVAAFNLIQVAAFFWVVRDRPAGMPKPEPSQAGMFKDLIFLWRRPSYLTICLASLFRYGSVVALQGLWAGPFLIYSLGFSQVAVGNAVLAISVGYMVSLPLTGRLSDSWLGSRKWVVVFGLFASGVIFFFMIFLHRGVHEFWVWLLFFGAGVAFGPGQVVFAHVKELTPPRLTATAMTGVNFVNMLGPAVLIMTPGLLLPDDPAALNNSAIFNPVWLVISVGLVATAVIYSFVPDTRPGSEAPIPTKEQGKAGPGD